MPPDLLALLALQILKDEGHHFAVAYVDDRLLDLVHVVRTAALVAFYAGGWAI